MKLRYVLLTMLLMSVYLTVKNHHVIFAAAQAQEEFHQTYQLSRTGRIDIDNINGFIHVATGDTDRVKVDAVKSGDADELKDVEIQVSGQPENLIIHTRVPSIGRSPQVDYIITVPKKIALVKLKTVNGPVTVAGVFGTIDASSVNGAVAASQVSTDAKLSTVNGAIIADFDQLKDQQVKLNTVNGAISIHLPANASTQLNVSTQNGAIEDQFGLPIKRNFPIGSELNARLGEGAASLSAQTVNGAIHILKESPSTQPVQ